MLCCARESWSVIFITCTWLKSHSFSRWWSPPKDWSCAEGVTCLSGRENLGWEAASQTAFIVAKVFDHFKGALSRYSVFYVNFFCGRKWQRGDSRPRRRPMSCRPRPQFFFTCSELRDWLTSKYQSVVLAKSFLSLGRSWTLRYDQESERTSLPINNGEKFMESKTDLLSSTDGFWVVLVRRSFKPASQSFRCSCVFRNTVQCTLRLKTIGNRKGDCAWSCWRWQTQPEKICKSQRTNQCHSLRTLYWFVLCNLLIFSGCVCHLEQLHAQSPFLFPIVFSLNLTPFFDICSVDYLLFFPPVVRVCAALLGPLHDHNSCCLWFWQLVFGDSLQAATASLPLPPTPLKQQCAPRWEKA